MPAPRGSSEVRRRCAGARRSRPRRRKRVGIAAAVALAGAVVLRRRRRPSGRLGRTSHYVDFFPGRRGRRRLRGGIRSVIVPSAISAANPIVSDSVGCGWIVSADVLGVRAHLERVDGLGDQLAGVDADDPGAEQPARARLEQQLGHALVAAQRQRAAGGGPREHGLLVLDARRPWPSVSVSPIHATSGSV